MNKIAQLRKTDWRKQPYFTYFFLGAQIIVFLICRLPQFRNLEFFGGMIRYFTVVDNQFWRLITPIFFHFNLEHLFFNSLILYFMGRQLESLYGHWRFLVIYLTSGILGNAFGMAFQQDAVLSLGASTSILGIYGAILAFCLTHRQNPQIRQMLKTHSLFVAMTFISSIFSAGVDLYGHLGGLIGGFLIGTVVYIPNGSKDYSIHKRISASILYLFLVIFCFVLALKKVGLLV
ncbi:rhomboid protease GluP [Enterococcus sp. PF1-24]|uniref:rhomboid family intramembrane serine protease n=1 Tax=unclassified Enterococcus TaxID=2608891 RepID=UPI002474C023|nr:MULTISPECIES: rhomboid family intramembrane serine protease [unclassified Enterococcus]MDH6365283.1 rhomboid protease GluP [Enterococcus sp. PFB1-1]MDH6402387.1 rhomboid protease GluP [Enterococcus sp. PF1-24]